MIFNHLIEAYTQIENMIASSDPAIDEKLSNLATYIHENGQAIQDDLLKHDDHIFLLRKIGQIKNEEIHNSCELLELKVLLKGDDPKKLAEWVIANKEIISSENRDVIFDALSKAKKRLERANLVVPEVGNALSHLITSRLGLNGEKDAATALTTILSIFNEEAVGSFKHWIKNRSDPLTTLKGGTLEALAHWMNSEKIPLSRPNLSERELEAIAPYLQHVDCRDVPLKNPEKFINLCSNANYLNVSHNKYVTELKQLPPHLQTLECNLCSNLITLDTSNNPQLQILSCDLCASLKQLDISNNPELRELNCGSTSISTLNLSKNPQLRILSCPQSPISALELSHNLQLQELICGACPRLLTLDPSNNPQLRVLKCAHCPISALDLSHNLQLQELNCGKCPLSALAPSNNPQLRVLKCSHCPIPALDLSHNLQLQTLYCDSCPVSTLDPSHNVQLQELSCSDTQIPALDLSNNPLLHTLKCVKCSISTLDFSNNLHLKTVNCSLCQNLTSLGAALPNTLERLNCENCPNLSQLPQLPATATVHSGNSLCGALNSFNVYPADLEEKPNQVLLDLGKILLKNKPFPNIVYMDPVTGKTTAGVDAGGLRRQLVSTLCENLFKKDSRFSFVEEAGYQTPTLDEEENPDALRTFARLIGLAATSSLLTGTNLDPRFFQTLFTLTDQEIDQPFSEDLEVKLYMARQGLTAESFTEEDKKDMLEEASILRATMVAAKELKKTLGDRFRKQNIKEFIVNVQGVPITKEKLKATIHCNNDNYKRWIDKFIDNLPLTIGKQTFDIKHLNLLFSGYYSIGDRPITIEVFPERKYLNSSTVIHTCSMWMELPGDLDQDLLHKELTDQLVLLKTFNAF
jgi:hypothetical protein